MRPWTESYLSRWASVGASVKSFTATKSRSSRSRAARSTQRPIRPKPLIPTRVAIFASLVGAQDSKLLVSLPP